MSLYVNYAFVKRKKIKNKKPTRLEAGMEPGMSSGPGPGLPSSHQPFLETSLPSETEGNS